MTPDGVHPLSLEFDFGDRELTIHPTVVETDHGLVLVDVGLPGAVDRLEPALDDLGFALADVSTVMLTHHDGDHAGGLSELEEATDVFVVAHADEVPYVDGEEQPVKSPPDAERYPPVPVDLELVGDEVFRTHAGPMRVVETPGHAPGHVSLYFPDHRFLVAADALNNDDGFVGPKPEYTPDMATAIESVGTLADLDVETTHCYHGGTADAGTDAIREIYESLSQSRQ
ncbi:MBL fold metallo-hydrolase [Haloarchaeobius amylolyticus]|uniref:MBL fold metallo-hydrolase n=1 Tax=Haloarchaeobius amylolyticus TaxID=1198296 RepID=UPI00226D587B|nr:MBL fold metallo-hydrolase [Haloarchaeobius amylolyticus]